MWFYVAKTVKSGFMWLKVVLCGSKYVLPNMYYFNADIRKHTQTDTYTDTLL